MSLLTTHADRVPVDLSRFIFATGRMGCLKTLDTTFVQPGDSYECDMIGSFRLSPLRRGLALDTKLELFTFYIPMRYIEDMDWNAMIETGPDSGLRAQTIFLGGTERWNANYLGTSPNANGMVPKFLTNAYNKVYNNYFKIPEEPDLPIDPANWIPGLRQTGYPIAHLKNWWTAPLAEEYTDTGTVDVDTTGGTFNIQDMAQSAGRLHAMQERALFAHRYRDIIEMLHGDAPIDVDQRPQLIQRTETWASGYDVDGSGDSSLGQFSGRIQQSFNHKVPRFYCREHGIVMTFIVPRFPPVHALSIPYLSGHCEDLDYTRLVHDPAVVGVGAGIVVPLSEMFTGGSTGIYAPMAEQQWFRVAEPDHVDERYLALEGFPFLSSIPQSEHDLVIINPDDYDQMFQTDQLFHWNTQVKTNVTCHRYSVTARDTLMNDD